MPQGKSKKQGRAEINVTHQPVVCADDVNLLGGNINIIKKNAEALSDASKEVGVWKWRGETKCMFPCRHQTAAPGQTHRTKAADEWFEVAAELRCLGTDVNRDRSDEEIRRRRNSGKGCRHAVRTVRAELQFQVLFCVGVTRGLWR
jgi:hypothetical protein